MGQPLLPRYPRRLWSVCLLPLLLAPIGCGSRYHSAAQEWSQSPQERLAQRIDESLEAQDAAVGAIRRALETPPTNQPDDARAATLDRADVALVDFQRSILSLRDQIAPGASEPGPQDESLATLADRLDAVHARLFTILKQLRQEPAASQPAAEPAFTAAAQLAERARQEARSRSQ